MTRRWKAASGTCSSPHFEWSKCSWLTVILAVVVFATARSSLKMASRTG